MEGVDLEELWSEHADAVHAYAARRVGHATAGDIVTEVFLIAFHRTDPIPDPPRAWLLGVARNVVRHEQRADRRRLRRESPDPLHRGDPQPDQEIGTSVAVEAIKAAIETLPHLEQEAILLVAWDQLNPGEAAIVAGCSPGTFRVRLHRARKRLERQLEAQESLI